MKTPYIAVEGGEGSGKSSLVAAVKEEFGDRVLVTREPGGSPDGQVIRRLALTHPLSSFAPAEALLYLMFADRFDHVEKVILPALQKSIPVIVDRSDASSYAYQVVAGKGDRGSLEPAFAQYRKKLFVLPDLYLFLDLDPAIGLARRKKAGETNHLDDRPLAFHEKVRQGFKDFRDLYAHRSVVIDANRPFDEVKADFFEIIRKELNRFR